MKNIFTKLFTVIALLAFATAGYASQVSSSPYSLLGLANAWTGAQTHSGAETHSGPETHSGVETHSNAETHSGAESHTGAETFSTGIVTHAAAETHSGAESFSSASTNFSNGVQVGGKSLSGWVLLDTQTASASANLQFLSDITSTYTQYMFVFKDLLESSSTTLQILYSINNSTFVGTNESNYIEALTMGASPANALSGNSGSALNLTTTSGVAQTLTGYIMMSIGTGTGTLNSLLSRSGNNTLMWRTQVDINAAVNAIEFLPAAGTFTSGTIYLYGLRNT